MKLYTEEQLFDICQSVAEKMCANSLPRESVIDKCKYYGHSKNEIDIESIKELFAKLTNDERMEVMGDYCKHCGRDDSGCQCWNDD